MILAPQDAKLVLILLGRHQESAIRPGQATAEDTLALINKLRECASENNLSPC